MKTLEEGIERECRVCKQTKMLNEFVKDKSARYGRCWTCNSCGNIDASKRRRSRPFIEEYHIWHSMRMRCTNKKRREYKHYGGRGISFCPSWNSFERFLSDMGPKPTKKHTLDRVDNNGNYCAENCRWATWREQAQNRRPRETRHIQPVKKESEDE